MSTTLTINFTANAGDFDLDGSKFFGPPAELANSDFKTRDPIAWAVAQEFNNLGTTSGVVTITAV